MEHHSSQILQGVNIHLDANLTLAEFNEHFKSGALKGTIFNWVAWFIYYLFAVVDSFPKVSPSLPQAILVNELSEEEEDDEDDDEITVDV